jgi:hypothetical protein
VLEQARAEGCGRRMSTAISILLIVLLVVLIMALV